MDHSLQIRERCERPFLGYILVPCCSEECCNGQMEKIQTMSSAYTTTPSSSSYETFSPQRFNSYKDSATRVPFPAIRSVRLQQPQESSRLKFGLEQLPSTLRGSYLQAQPRWKTELTSKPKRNRTIFTADQLERLEKEFARQQYIVGTERFYLAADLGLNETQVKVWFQNRRIKWRRQNLDS